MEECGGWSFWGMWVGCLEFGGWGFWGMEGLDVLMGFVGFVGVERGLDIFRFCEDSVWMGLERFSVFLGF